MGLLTDRDFENKFKYDIRIDPSYEKCFTGVGYDLRVGDTAYSFDRWGHNAFIKIDKCKGAWIRPGETWFICTKEIVRLSSYVAGLICSSCAFAHRGFSHVSTTIDPNWEGQLVIQIKNISRYSIKIEQDTKFCTMVLFPTETPSYTPLYGANTVNNSIDSLKFHLDIEEGKRRRRKSIFLRCTPVIIVLGIILIICFLIPDNISNIKAAIATIIGGAIAFNLKNIVGLIKSLFDKI